MASNKTFTLNIKALFDASDVKAKVGDIESALKNIKLPDKLSADLNKSFAGINKALDEFVSKSEKGIKTKADATGINKSFEAVTKELNNLDNLLLKVKTQLGEGVDLSKIITFDTDVKNQLESINQQVEKFQKEINKINADKLKEVEQEFSKLTTKGAKEQGAKALELFKEGDGQAALSTLDAIITKLEAVKNANISKGNDITNIQNNIDALGKMREAIEGAYKDTQPLIEQQNSKIQEGAQIAKSASEAAKNNLNGMADSWHKVATEADGVTPKLQDLTASQAQLARELDQVKSRIQYFFGLSNAINLAKRAVRGAVNTIKDLDKVMTETAVVTDFSVSDMWEQLPEYTKRANELGVTTKAAYEAATLYYQQGLNTNEVNALSVETLKMARIAGLDAAEATDRMTNALRGFNMELSADSAQRVDDVYSELAANTASNVDEISTAMTKVASLAHSANMEFETTAAFLAQIIETTRESAETAGTALKTVVARFSEVKKLYDANQLKGTDEEGQAIDVNKIGTALRTAGIDLNKYFLGEVGLDDIFMELASKWDDLTSLQQRYIATQAAGSRQQSRFIALMQDYARTQELVGKAYNSEGASAHQFEKTQESLESKLNRLSNAWNEFLMGLSNSTVVKGFVDGLTTLLNIVNNLTSAFGDGIGSILKWGVALSSIAGGKALFKSGGALDALLGSILNGTGIGNALFQNQVLSGKLLNGGAAKGSQYAAELAAGTTQVGASSGILARLFPNLVKSKEVEAVGGTVGKNIADSVVESVSEELDDVDIAEEIFESQWGESAVEATNKVTNATKELTEGIENAGDAAEQVGKTTVTNLTSILSILGVLAVVAAAIAASYALWLKYTPAGQLKQSKQLAATMENVAVATQKTADSFKDAQRNYNEYNEKIKNAATVSDRTNAIRERSDYVTSLMQDNPQIAKYVSAQQQNGEIVLTIDETQFNQAIQEATEGATQAAINADFTNALQAGKQADMYQAWMDQAEADLINKTIKVIEVATDQYGNEVAYTRTRQMTEQEYAQYSAYQRDLDTARTQQRAYAQQGYSRQLLSAGLSDELANELSSVLAEAFNEDAYLTAINVKRNSMAMMTKEELEAIYFKTFGALADSSMDKTALISAIATSQVNEQIQKGTIEAASYLTGPNAKLYKNILDAFSGVGTMAEMAIDMSEENIEQMSSDDIAKMFGFDNLDATQLEAFAKAMGTDTDGIYDHIKASLKNTKQIQAATKANIYQKMFEAGLNISTQDQKKIESFSPAEATKISETISSAQDLLKPDAYQSLINNIVSGTLSGDTLDQVNNLFKSIDLNDAIGAFHQLSKAKEEASAAGNKQLLNYINQIEQANSELFSASGLVQSFFVSTDYDSITDSLDKFIKENGKITSKNVEELAESNSKLKQLLDANVVSAAGLAQALTLVENGTIGFENLTDAMLSALSAGTSFEELIEQVSSWIKDFDAGTDLKEGSGHIIDELGKLQEYVSNWEFGNEPTKNIYEHIFGGSYDEIVTSFGHDFDGLEKFLTQRITELSDRAENAGLGGIQKAVGEVTGLKQLDTEGLFFEWNLESFNTTDDAIKEVADALQITQEAAESFILSWQTHMPDLRKDWNELQYKTQLGAFADEIENQTVLTKQQLEALGQLVGKTAEQVQTDLEQLAVQKGIDLPVIVNWQDEDGNALTGEGLLSSFRESFGGAEDFAVTIPILVSDDSFTKYERVTRSVDKAFASLQQYINTKKGTIDVDALFEDLLSKGLTRSQAADIANQFVGQINGAMLSRTIQIPHYEFVDDGNGNQVLTVTQDNVEVQADTMDGLTQAADLALQAAQYDMVGQMISNQDVSGLGDKVADAIRTGGETGAGAIPGLITAALAGTSYTIEVVPHLSTGGLVMGGAPARALGGIVKSYAKGSENFKVKPGTALTGEEGPELVWNKNSGYAYLTGGHGAEFQDLQPGDRIFNAEETQKILRNSTNSQKKYFGSFAKGGWKKTKDKNAGIGADAGKSGKEKDEEWKNEIDWLYNLVEDIAELERIQTQFQEDYDDYLTDQNKTGRDLYNLLVKQLGNLQAQLDHQTFALEKREQEMREFMDTTNTYDDYLWYNWTDRTIEIDWDQIEAIKASDKETYDEIADLISEAEKIQGKMDDAEDAIIDVKNQIQELENIWRDTFTDFEERVYEAIVKEQQTVIDSYSDLNENLNNSNSAILDSLQKQISLERQIRDNTKTEEDINENEARLAYLQRDTTGGNNLASLELQRELDEQRQDYEDNLIDQAISRLQEDNDLAAQQREHQIEIMQAQLDYQSENGEFNDLVSSLLSSAMGADGELLTNSDLVTLLKDQENWGAMSDVSRQVWEEELTSTYKEVAAFLLKQTAEEIGTFLTDVNKAVTDIYAVIGSKSQPTEKNTGTSSSKSSSGGGGGGSGGSNNKKTTTTTTNDDDVKVKVSIERAYNTRAVSQKDRFRISQKYATGGLADFSGPAWLDGTPSEPEYVLNARQTDAFLKLADVLPSIMESGSSVSTLNTSNITLNLEMNVDQISSDYDVDRIAGRVKDIIYNAGSYRNVNVLNFSR